MVANTTLLTTATRKQLILESALSVAMQTVTPQWLVHIDDGGDWSDTVAKIKQLVPHVIISQKKMGRVASLIFLHSLVTTDYVGWLDDDDWLNPHCISECSKELPFIITKYWEVNNGKVVLGMKSYFHYFQYSMKLYNAVGGLNPNFTTAMDTDLRLRLSEKKQPYFIDKALYYYRVHDDRITVRQAEEQARNVAKAKYNHQLRTV